REPTDKGPLRKQAQPIATYTQQLEAITQTLIAPDEGDVLGRSQQAGLWGFILTAAAWGLISLVTPCVFPMIPITVSIFLKQAHGSLSERLKLAAVYSLTIITVLGVSAFALLKFMAILSAHPITNLLLAALFIILALSLFGMYELSLPGSLQKRLQAGQSRGGVIGTIFGALAFTVISFTCVAPFLGGFAGISAGSTDTTGWIVVPTAREIAGGLAFATAFAMPFFVLALIPSLMRALPKSGGWLDSVKVVMGFLELAAALKFLRTAELRIFPTPQYFTYDVVLGGWVAISAACGLYLLNLFRLPHDEDRPHIGVPRLLFALFFLALAIYLAPGLLPGPDGKPQRPAGAVYAWVEAFLLPEAIEEGWSTDLPETLAAARQSGKPVFVDFTGVTCTNCKYNESNIFPLPGVHEQLRKFERVQLYTDEVPAHAYATDPGPAARRAEARANGEFQIAAFKASQLPLYAVLMPQGDRVRIVGIYPEGKINNPEQFTAFLKDALEKAKR
ncbi:MAG: thioredoxin family protein, partial [Gemmataceae bacterium]|nr:thioredoxin family protein [Gemmata sp.]MDW8198379.1 thioredoxin family protein [Gemmataceae bacterium]